MGDLFRYTAHIPGVTVHFLRRGGLFLTGRSYGAHLIRRGQHHLLDALQSFSGLARQLGGGAHILHGFADKPVALGRAALNILNGLSHALGGLHGLFRQFAHFIGHHGKAPAGFPGPRGLNGGIQRQQIGLIRNIIDDIHHLPDIINLPDQPGHTRAYLVGAVLHFGNAAHYIIHAALARLGFLLGLFSHMCCIGSIARHIGHGLIHLIHGARGIPGTLELIFN